MSASRVADIAHKTAVSFLFGATLFFGADASVKYYHKRKNRKAREAEQLAQTKKVP